MFALEMINTAQKGKKIQLKLELCVGSGSLCQLRAQHQKLYPLHARFTVDEENVQLTVEAGDDDAHVYVNGHDVLHSELKHDDVVKVGPLRFKVVDQRFNQQTEARLEQLLDNLDDDDEVEIYDFAKEDLFYLTTKDPSLRTRISFRIPSRDRFIDQAQQFLARLVKQSGMDEMKVEAFMTCTKELILNAHRHGHEYDESKTITLHYRDANNAITVTIEDQGTGFDHESALGAVRGKSAADAARERYKAGGFGGLGFQMITRMADDIQYNEAGNIVTYKINKDFE